MTGTCLDIGTIQAFLDGELAHDEAGRVSSHIADCGECAYLFAEAEDEAAVVFPALERELDTLVPTQRLWNRINDSIAAEKAAMPWWKKAWGLASIALANPSMAAAASLLVVFGIFAAVWVNRTSGPAAGPQSSVATTASRPSELPPPVNTFSTSSEPDIDTSASPIRIEKASMRVEPRKITPSRAAYRPSPYADPASGETSYVSTISTLSRTVESKMDGALRPSQRVAFERDMAVIDDAIAKMKKEVKRNPKNETARQVLYASYQNKIDLLNSVAQKEELMASIK